MLTKRNFVVILLTLSYESRASGYNNYQDYYNEARTCEAKISAALEVLKTENIRKLDVLAKNIADTLEKYLEHKLSILLENNNQAMQEDIYEIFEKLEIKSYIVDKLEQYVDDKLNYLEKHVDRKIETIEKIMTPYQNTSNCNFDALYKALTKFEDKLDHEWTEFKKMVPKLEENIELKLDTLYKNVPKYFEDIINLKLDKMDKNMISLKDNVLSRLDTLEKQLEKSIEHKLEETEKNIPELKQNMNNRIDALQNIEKDIYAEIYQTRYTLGCKEQRTIGRNYVTPYYRIDDQALKHISLKKDQAGLSDFEMHFAVKGENYAYILLSPLSESVLNIEKDVVYEIGIWSDIVHLYYMRKIVLSKQIPNILSSTRFTAFYVNINNGHLELGKDGTSRTPIFTYSDAGLKTVKYFSSAASPEKQMTFLYDCPSNVFQRLFD